MTVKELIEKLNSFPKELRVLYNDPIMGSLIEFTKATDATILANNNYPDEYIEKISDEDEQEPGNYEIQAVILG